MDCLALWPVVAELQQQMVSRWEVTPYGGSVNWIRVFGQHTAPQKATSHVLLDL